jgi:hypothetical protein
MRTTYTIVLCFLLAGCSNHDKDARLAALEAQDRRLETETRAQRHELDRVKADIEKVKESDMNGFRFLLEGIDDAGNSKPAVLSVTDRNFSVARSSFGSFPLRVTNAVPYMDGYKITLSVGNPLAADITAGKILIEFGESPTGALSSVSQDIEQPILGGGWTDVDIIIAPVTASQLAYLEVSLEPTQIALVHE